MKRKDKGITDEKLQDLTRAVSKLVAITTTDLNELRALLEEQSQAIGVLATRHDGLAADVEEVREHSDFHAANIAAAGTFNADAPNVTLTDVFISELEAEEEAAGTGPYPLANALNLYVSGDGDAYDTAIELLQEARAAHQDPVNLILSVQWEAADNGEPAYFAGNLAVSQ